MIFWSINAVAFICLTATLLAQLPFAHGAVRIFDFPRLQITAISAVTFLATLILLPSNGSLGVAVAGLVIALVLQLAKIARFTRVWPVRVRALRLSQTDRPPIRLLVSNVKMSNRDYGQVQHVAERLNPDIAIFMETDTLWIDALSELAQRYTHAIKVPQDNTYGMLVLSNLKTVKQSVNYLLNENVPSFDGVFELEDGARFRLLAVHPEPPVPFSDTIGRDGEISLVAKLVCDETLPVIVTGDLNDVAWSDTTRRFLRVSRMLDPREGRGMFNSFDARYFFIRWPLDHMFLSRHFQIIDLRRLEFVGSDHFPMYYEVALLAGENANKEMPEAQSADLHEAEHLIEEARELDRRPVGDDWER